MRDDQVAIVEHEVTDELVEELGRLLLELGRLIFELCKRLGESMGQLDIAAAEGADKLDVMVAWNAQRSTGLDHRQHKPQHRRYVGTAVNEVAQKDGLATFGVLRSRAVFRDVPAELA